MILREKDGGRFGMEYKRQSQDGSDWTSSTIVSRLQHIDWHTLISHSMWQNNEIQASQIDIPCQSSNVLASADERNVFSVFVFKNIFQQISMSRQSLLTGFNTQF